MTSYLFPSMKLGSFPQLLFMWSPFPENGLCISLYRISHLRSPFSSLAAEKLPSE